MSVTHIPSKTDYQRKLNLISYLRKAVTRDVFEDDEEGYELWMGILGVLSSEAYKIKPLTQHTRQYYTHFNRHFEVLYIEAQWALIETLEGHAV